jgi:transposase
LSLLPACLCPSCPIHADTPSGSGCEVYPSSLSDGQWALLEGLLPPPGNRTSWGGRPEKHPRRRILDAVFYLVRAGVAWRYLPKGFPPWNTVYGFFARWRADGTWLRIHDALRDRVRVAAGRGPIPTAAIIDSQSVRAAASVGKDSRGFDGGKKVNGRKRHIAVDACGLLLVVLVTAAGVQDRDAGHRVLALLRERFSTITLIWADGGYAGRLVVWARAVLRLTVAIVKRSDDTSGFVVLPRRWVVERTFGWLLRHRRLVRDYERLPEHHEAMVLWATVMIMTRQLVRLNSGAPPHPRWGGARTPTTHRDDQHAA